MLADLVDLLVQALSDLVRDHASDVRWSIVQQCHPERMGHRCDQRRPDPELIVGVWWNDLRETIPDSGVRQLVEVHGAGSADGVFEKGVPIERRTGDLADEIIHGGEGSGVLRTGDDKTGIARGRGVQLEVRELYQSPIPAVQIRERTALRSVGPSRVPRHNQAAGVSQAGRIAQLLLEVLDVLEDPRHGADVGRFVLGGTIRDLPDPPAGRVEGGDLLVDGALDRVSGDVDSARLVVELAPLSLGLRRRGQCVDQFGGPLFVVLRRVVRHQRAQLRLLDRDLSGPIAPNSIPGPVERGVELRDVQGHRSSFGGSSVKR
ncbi:hypothetical protein [Kribbella sp. ALI-6-A]|uniref:hypothetical protein n=1 Tax=Kribbella sp. ALI-6-A TaxID=1933817 RepID=UPI00117B5CE4|nr:hypothetical protein [Kribbella sp. ALI-6-A]